MQNHDHAATEPSADADLILRTRSGDADAYAELWRRHHPSGMSVARSITSSIDADDLVQEAYTRIYQAIIKGGGPNGSFRAYLFTSIRNTAAAWGRSRRETAMDELDTVADPDSTDQAADEALDRSLTAQAFRSLPTRWQEVLWYTEIEQMKPASVAPLLGMKSGAVAQLAFRAREGLREAWIQAHLRSAEPGSECQWTIEHVGAHSRGNLSARDQKRLDQHIDGCARCMIVVAEAKDVSNRLALVLLPLVLGVAGAAGYTAMLQGGGAPIAALAAMPSGVVEGGVVVTDAGTNGAVGVLANNGSGAAGGSPVAGGAGITGASSISATGAMTGIGALVGAGSAALVVAGVVAATTIVPGLLEASPVTSMPSASEAGDSSISSELAPDTEMNDEKFILEIPEESPKTPDAVEQAPEIDVPVDDGVAQTKAASPVERVAPPAAEDGSGADGDAGTTEPEPGTGTEEPGIEEPGTEEPAPGGGEGSPPTEPTPVLPDGTPGWSPATQTCTDEGGLLPVTHYAIPLTGAPDAAVRVRVDGPLNDGEYTTALDALGVGLVDVRPTGDQVIFASITDVSFVYVLGDIEGDVLTVPLSEIYDGPSCLTAPADEAPTDQSVEQPIEEQPVAAEPITQSAPETESAPVEDAPATVEEETVVEPTAVEEPVATEAATTEPAPTQTEAPTPTEAPAPAE